MASNASTNIDNTKEPNLKQSIFEIVKKLEEIPEDENSYARKVTVTVDLWKKVAIFSQISHPKRTDKLVEWVYFQTLPLVLEGRWLNLPGDQRGSMHQSVYNIINDMINKTKNKTENLSAFSRLLGLQNLIVNPWRNPALVAMFNEQGTAPSDEVLEFLCSERGHLLVCRLDILCETNCEDLALKFAELSLKCIRLPGNNSLRHHVSKDQTYYIIDVYIALLHKFDRTQDCIQELRKLTLEEGLDCIRRFNTKQTDIRVWKHCFKLAELASQVFVVLALRQPHQNGSKDIFYHILTEWALLQLKQSDKAMFPEIVRKFGECADTANHIYTMCTILIRHLDSLETTRVLVLELYIRAINKDVDLWEMFKTDENMEKVKETEYRLSDGYLAMAELLKDEIGVYRECILTAFSLNPSEQCYNQIKVLAVLSGKLNSELFSKKQSTGTLDTGQVSTWKCYLHPPCHETEKYEELDLCSECGEFRQKIVQSTEHSLDALLSITGRKLTQAANYDVYSAPSRILDPVVLKLPRHICDDLAIIINNPRVKTLSWVDTWADLSKTCQSYMNDREGEKKFNKELKYLHVDYNQFKNWPKNNDINNILNYIEKGYENYLENYASILEETKKAQTEIKPEKEEVKSVKKIKKISKNKNKVRIVASDNSNNSCDIKAKHKIKNHSNDIDTEDSLGSDVLKCKSRKTKKIKTKSVRTLKKNDTLLYSLAETKENKNASDNKNLNLVEGEAKLNSDTSHIASILSPEKKSSDPKVLQSLRKYRPHLKSRPSNKSDVKESCVSEYAPMLSELNLSPRVMLDRYPDMKDWKKSNNDPSVKFNLNNNNINRKYCENDQRGNYEDKRNLSVNCNILAGIPGLSSFDMLIPERVQPVVQIVQLAQNTNKQPSTSSAKVSRSSNQPNMSVVTSMPSTSTDVTTSSQSEILSTPVTPHIQRIGQATLNCDPAQIVSPTISVATNAQQSNSQIPQTSSATLPDLVPASQSLEDTNVSISTSQTNATAVQSSTVTARQKLTNTSLANLLTTNRIVMPAKSTPVQSKSNPTIINVLSQKILRAPYSSSSITNCTSATSTAQSISHITSNPITSISAVRHAAISLQNSIRSQSPGTHIATSSQTSQQLLQIFNSHKSATAQVIKGVNILSNISGQPEPKMVQFFCKADGKTFQLTPFAANPANVRIQQVDSNRTFKAIPQTQVRPALETAANINTRSVYEENYAKFIQTANKISHVHNAAKQPSTTTVTSTINSSQNTSLPKFNQAFGKAAFHNTSHASSSETGNDGESTNMSNNVALTNLPVIKTYKSDPSDNSILNTVVQNSISPVIIKRSQLATSTSTVTTLAGTASRTAMTPLSVQTVHGGVIYTRQIPISAGPLFNANMNRGTLKIAQASDTQPIVPVAIPSPVVVSKNSIIRNKVNTILTATFSSPVVSSNMQGSTNAAFANQSQTNSRDANSSEETVQTSLPQPLYALQTSLPIKLAVPSSTMFTNAKIVRPVVQIPGKLLTTTSPIKQQLVLTATPTSASRICQNVRLADNLISTSPMDASVSSSTLEQLREFDMVLEQVKERSTVQPNLPVSAASPVSISSNISHGLLIPHSRSESTEPEIQVSNTSFGQEVVFTTTVSPLAQRLNLTYMSQNLAKLAANAPVVVVTNYQQAPSPALSVTSQSSSSPCVTPAPTTPNSSAGKTPPKVSSKSKSKSVKTSSTNTSKASPVPKPPQKPQEDEQTAQRIYDILAEYAEQLRNSPDLNNKPAPRRRSNPSANPGQNSKRKKTSGSKRPSGQGTSTASEMSPGADDHHTMGSEDSSCGLVQISMQNSPSQGIPSVEDCLHADTSSDVGNIRSVQSDSSDCPTTEVRSQTSARHLIFTDPNSAQQRNVIIADSAVSEALAQVGKLGTSTAAVLVPGNYILPMSMVKGGQQITIVSGGSKILATVPGRPGTNANALVLQSIINQAQKPLLAQQSTMKMTGIQTVSGITQHSVAGNQTGLVQTLTSTPQLTQQLTYIDTNNTSSNTATITPQGAIFLNSNSSNNHVIRTSPSTACSTNVTGFISKSPAVVRTYSTITHTSGASNVPELSQSESVKIKDNYGGEENGKLKLNIISDVSTIVSANNIISEGQGRYTLSIAPQTVLCQSATHATSTADTQTTTKVSKQKTTKESSVHQRQIVIPIESPNIVVSTSNPVIKLVHSAGHRIQSINSNEVFETSDTSQDHRTQSVLINANENIINGPLLSQVTNTVFQDLSTVISSSAACGENIDDNQSKMNDLQKEEKSENGLVDQNEIFTKESTPWRYVPTSSGVEYLTMGDQIKFFRDNVDSHNDNAIEKNNDEIGIAKTYQSHMQSDLVRKRFVNSMICSTYANKSERLKNATSRMTKELQQQTMERKQAALERELRLQKSLSEECEDLGVDEPSTSDLFPEADLLFDPPHSFDQNSQDATCSQTVGKNYTRTNFKTLDSSSNSGDTDFAKEAPEKMKVSNNPAQSDSFLTEHQRSKISSAEEHISSGTSLRSSNTFIDQAPDDKKGTSLSDFDNNSEFIFNATSFSRSVDDSCMELVFENTDKNSNKNGKDDSLHATHNSNSNSFESSGEQTPTEASPGLPSDKARNKFRNKYTYSNCKAKEDSDKIAWESELEHSTTEDEMQFTEDDSSQSQLDSFRGTSVDIEEPILKNALKRAKQDSLDGNGLNLGLGNVSDMRQSRKAECGLTNKKRTASQAHMENYSNSPISPSEEHSEESNKGSTRRLSLRGHVKKNCPCCNGKTVVETVPVVKKARTKIDHLKPIKVTKKSVTQKSSKSNISKKR